VADPLSDIDLQRLIKLCGLLGSMHEGERAAAAAKVSEFLLSRSLTWTDVLVQQEPPLPQVSVTVGDGDKEPSGPPWRSVARDILSNYQNVLRGDRELGFVEDMYQRLIPLTERQENWLRAIAARAGLTW
jgi:hypothetical protein